MGGTASEHQREQMAKNPKQNTSVAQPSAAASQNLAGMKATAESKGQAMYAPKGGLHAPGNMGLPADPADAGGAGD